MIVFNRRSSCQDPEAPAHSARSILRQLTELSVQSSRGPTLCNLKLNIYQHLKKKSNKNFLILEHREKTSGWKPAGLCWRCYVRECRGRGELRAAASFELLTLSSAFTSIHSAQVPLLDLFSPQYQTWASGFCSTLRSDFILTVLIFHYMKIHVCSVQHLSAQSWFLHIWSSPDLNVTPSSSYSISINYYF